MTANTTVHKYDDATPGAWKAFIKVMRSGEVFECDRAMYWYWLEVLPPVWMNRPLKVDGHGTVSTFGFAEGDVPCVAFWQKGNRYFGVQTKHVRHPQQR